jgi:uncharacterized protein (TIGR02996 family)
MLEDESFLRAVVANPEDRVARLVYADWLDERSDPRAEFLRVEAQLAEMPRGGEVCADLNKRMRELQASLPRWWLLLVGGLRATRANPESLRTEVAALALGRRVKITDARGYEITIESAATCMLNGRVAFLESRSKWNGGSHDIRYDLRLRDFDGNATSWEPVTYNPYFGCDTRFMEWFGDAVLFIYREKRHTYIARVGFDSLPDYREIADNWVLNGREIGHIGWGETAVRRLSIPQLVELPPLSITEAAELELLPDGSWVE